MTPAFAMLLTTCAVVAAPAGEKDPTALAETTLQCVAKLPAEHQQVWLRLVEQRYNWAVLVSMKPEDAEQEKLRVAGILHQKTVAWNDMVALLRQLDQREKAAVSHMVRVYRTTVYESFHKRQQEFMDRQEAWFRIWSAWEKAGSPPEQQDRLMDWLADAIKASSKGSLGPLPADPKFGREVELVPEALVKRLREEEQKRRVAEAPPPRPSEAPPASEPPVSPPLPTRLSEPAWTLDRAHPSDQGVLARHGEALPPALTPTIAAQMPPLHDRPASVPGDPLELTALPAPPRYAAALVVNSKVSDTLENAGQAIARSGDRNAGPQSLSQTRPRAELPPSRAVVPATEPAVAGLPPVVALPSATAPQGKAEVDSENTHVPSPRSDVVAMLPRGLMQSSDTSPESPPRYQVQRKPLAPEEPHAQVNVDELRTRVSGINLSLRTLEGELNDKRELTADQLESLLSRLDILVLRQRDLTLFRDLISSQEQARVGQVDSARIAISTLGTRIAELRTRIRQNETTAEAARTAALKQLDDLSDRLATLTAEK